MSRLRFIVVLGFLAALFAGCGRRQDVAKSNPPLRRVTLQTDWFPQAEHGGYYQALAKGYYAQAGGMPFVIVAATAQHDMQGLMVHEGSPVRSFKDLDGRTVIGNVGMTWFPYLEKKFGISIERRQNTYGLGEFLANPDTIQQCLVTNEPFFAEQRGRKVRTLPLSASGYDCYQTLFTRRELVRTSPDVVRRFVVASIRGWRDYLDGDPAPADDMILKRNADMTRELLTYSRDALIRHGFIKGDPARGEDIGEISMERLQQQMKTLLELKVLESPVDVSAIATREFLPRKE
jgi:NitT/TauT family transport system substrate-binding protein